MSLVEMVSMLPRLKLPLTMADLREAIGALMRKRSMNDSMTVDPYEFVKGLAWHRKPSQVPGLRRELDVAKARRVTTAERAIQLAAAHPHSLPRSAKIPPRSEVKLSKLRRAIEAAHVMVDDIMHKTQVCGAEIASLAVSLPKP